MAKKNIWVGLGIGCGALILIAVVAVGAGAYWMKSRFGGFADAVKQAKAQQLALRQLDRSFPFHPGADGEPTLTEARLQDYLAIRAAVLAPYQKIEAQAESLKQKKDGVTFKEGVQAVNAMTELSVQVEQHYVDALTAHRMSPAEFRAITQVALSETAPTGPNAALLTRYQAQLAASRSPGLDEMLSSGSLGKAVKQSAQ